MMPPSPPNAPIEMSSSILAIMPTQDNVHAQSALDLKFQFLNGESSISSKLVNQFPMSPVQEQSQVELQTSETAQLANSQSEIAALKRELSELKQEKADLEILLEATAEHSDSVEAELHSTAIAALKQSEEMFRTIAEATPVPVLISRPKDGTILYTNAAASITFGITPEEFLSHSTLELYHDLGDRQKLLDAIERSGHVQNFEFQCKRLDGTLFWVAASLRRLIFKDEPALLTALCDITQRKQAEEALKRQVQELQIEIDHAKLAQQVAEITQSDYFQELKAEVKRLRHSEEDCEF